MTLSNKLSKSSLSIAKNWNFLAISHFTLSHQSDRIWQFSRICRFQLCKIMGSNLTVSKGLTKSSPNSKFFNISGNPHFHTIQPKLIVSKNLSNLLVSSSGLHFTISNNWTKLNFSINRLVLDRVQHVDEIVFFYQSYQIIPNLDHFQQFNNPFYTINQTELDRFQKFVEISSFW